MNALVRPGRSSARQTAQKPRSFEAYSFPAPTLGLVSMNNLSVALPGSATVLENWMPTPTGATTRRGKKLYATLGNGLEDVTAMFSYVVGDVERMFGATNNAIYDISTVTQPNNILIGTENEDIIGTEDGDMLGVLSTENLDRMTGLSGGDWVVVQFATPGGTYLIGANGQDPSFIYDGQRFYPQVAGGVHSLTYVSEAAPFTAGETVTGGTSGATGTIWKVEGAGPGEGILFLIDVVGNFTDGETIADGGGGEAAALGAGAIVPGTGVTFPSGVDLTTADLDYVWVYKNRIFFIQKDSLTAWYLPVDSLGGDLTDFSLGGTLNKGGRLMIGTTWSQDVGDGLNALCAFVSSEGEAAVYQGSNPSDAANWGIVGVYQTGKPMGKRAHVRLGGDIALATDVAFVPLSEALRRDHSQLSQSSLSHSIEALWPQYVEQRRGTAWHSTLWTARQLVLVAFKPELGKPHEMLVMNSQTKRWAIFTNWASTCLLVFNNRLFCGDKNGRVYELNVTGLDDREPYTCTYVSGFDQMEKIGFKSLTMVRAVFKSAHKIKERVSVHTDYRVKLPAAPAASKPLSSSAWGAMNWGQAAWGAGIDQKVQSVWRSQAGSGEVAAVGIQITSGDTVPLDVELIRTDALFTVGDVQV